MYRYPAFTAVIDCDFGSHNPLRRDYINNPTRFINDTGWGNLAPRLVQDAQNNGRKVLGYVPTDDATGSVRKPQTLDGKAPKAFRTLAHIKKYVDYWYAWPGLRIDGIYFDEGPLPSRFTGGNPNPPDTTTVAPVVRRFYEQLYAYVKKKNNARDKVVMLNASEFQEKWVMDVADVVEVFEGDIDKYEQRY